MSPGGTLPAVSHQRDLFANFERMRREIDQLFGDVFERTGLRGPGFAPAVDVFYVDGPPRAIVRADLAGVLIDDVQLEIEHGPFHRTVELGADVMAAEAKAGYEDGILVVEVPLAPREQSVRRVPIEEGGEG